MLVAPTVYGNVLLGPTAEDIADRGDIATTAAGLAALMHAGRRSCPAWPRGGHRELRRAAGGDRGPGLPDLGRRQCRYACVGRNPLHRAVRVAGHRRVRRGLLGASRAAPRERAGTRPAAGHAEHRRGGPRPYRTPHGSPPTGVRARRVLLRAGHPGRDQGRAGKPDAARDTDALRRRTRVLNGRCQGFYCAAAVTELFAALGPPSPWSDGRRPRSPRRSPGQHGQARATESRGPKASGGVRGVRPRASTEPG